MYQDVIASTRPEMERTLEFFSKEIAKIRTGVASPALVEDVICDVFGQKMPIKQLAAISSPERRQLLIQPWDPSYIEPIERALRASSVGASPVVEQSSIRLQLPQLTEEIRGSLLKVLGDKTEEARKTFRKWRDEAWSSIQESLRKGEIREDDKFKGKEELQKLVDEYIGKAEELAERKKNEIGTI
jgi:ribosome recycling factor